MSSSEKIKFMTYNVWSCEHVAVYRRIKAISGLIAHHEPDVIFLQLSKLDACVPRWYGSESPRADATTPGLLSASVYKTFPSEHPVIAGNIQFGPQRQYVRVATCRLEGPTPEDVGAYNVVLGGDLGWDDDIDGPIRLRPGWVDAWKELRGGDEDGGGGGAWTYDTVANPMLRGRGKTERKRPDRFLCMLTDFRLECIEMVGVEPIPGVTSHYDDEGNVLPVLPSHHFGLLLTIAPKPKSTHFHGTKRLKPF
uniref:Endonuclease/exonuclease/phosphatase domain-containing protein n=1 Tax=Leersia perrieri TaxID=77586 RepID=A0A0D9WZC4_9ORYZ